MSCTAATAAPKQSGMGLSLPRQRLFHVKHQPTGPASQSISAVRSRPEESDRSDRRVLPRIRVAHAINASSPKGEPPRHTGDTQFARRRQCHAARPAMGTNPREQARGRRFLAHREDHARYCASSSMFHVKHLATPRDGPASVDAKTCDEYQQLRGVT